MIKSLNKNDTLTSPYIATKDWQLSNADDSNLILMEHSSSTICLEVLEYNQSQSFTGSSCSICSEHQENDLINFREGEKSDGIFYPNLEQLNLDGTYKRLVYSQVKEMFYNNYRDPTKMWGMENIDFDKSQTKKFISDLFRLYDVPRNVFGEKILENTVQVIDTTTDNDYIISDDGNGNLFAGPNLFSKQQELGVFENSFLTGSNTSCNAYFSI
jgi:hypothetical protein